MIPIPSSAESSINVTVPSNTDSFNTVLKSGTVEINGDTRETLIAYSDDGSNRTYSASPILGYTEGSLYNIYMGGRDTVIEGQDGTAEDLDLKLYYTENDTEYVALYNAQDSHPARIFGGWEKPTETPEEYRALLGVDNAAQEYKLTLKSGKIDSLRGASKEKTGRTVPKVTINVEGGSVDIIATGWYYLESVTEYTVTVSGGTVGTIYGNGQTSYKASVDMADGTAFVPTVDTAVINIGGGTVGNVYGSGWALTQDASSSDCSMLTKNANINITGGTVDYVNGGGFSGPEANWNESSGQDMVIVENAVINISGGDIYRVYGGGYNGQWRFTYKLNADGELVFSNYNGTNEAHTVRNIVNSATINISDSADIDELYMGGRSYARTDSSVVNMTGGTVGNFATSGSYGYTVSADANISGGTVNTLELVHRNYVGDIDLDVTGGTVENFYAGTGGAYKNSNLNETAFNISTIAVLGDVNVYFSDNTLTGGSYLTAGLERAETVAANVPLTVYTMNLAEDDGYTADKASSGKFVVENDTAEWDAIVVLSTANESFTSNADSFVCASGSAGMTATKDENGTYTLTAAAETPAAQIGSAYYPTLAAAYASAIDGSVIELLKDCGEDDAITVSKQIAIDLGEYTASISVGEGYTRQSSAEGLYVVVRNDSIANALNVTFRQVSEGDNTLYDIVLAASDAKTINRLSTADLTFALTTDSTISYAVTPYDGISIVNDTAAPNRYLFYFDTSTAPDASGTEIAIAQVRFTGYGDLDFRIDETAATNAAHTATIADNLVTDFIIGGGSDTDDTTGELNINETVAEGYQGTITAALSEPTHTLSVTVDFPNAISDNAAAYQDMRVVISGGGLTEPITKTFGTGENEIALTNGSYTFTEELAENTAYTVTVTGAGYRTVRRTVLMNADKELYFWNNVKDTAAEVEAGSASSAAHTTFLAGDILMDNQINLYDLSAVVSYFGQTGLNAAGTASAYAQYDLNRDGKIDSRDVAMVLVSWGY